MGLVGWRRVEREKSATKEAIALLHEYLGITEPIEEGEPNLNAKRAKTEAQIGSEASDQKSPALSESKTKPQPGHAQPTISEAQEPSLAMSARDEPGGADEADKSTTIQVSVVGAEEPVNGSAPEAECSEAEGWEPPKAPPELFLVKLARKGMVYISIPSRTSRELIMFFAKILREFHTRERATPRWCHRIFPVQATCLWIKDDVRGVVVTLVKDFLEGRDVNGESPLKYAVAVNRRGLEEKESAGAAPTPAGSFGKMECIHAVAEAVKSVTQHTVVDLTNPQMVVIVEVLPLVRAEAPVCAVSVLPRELVVTKPKLLIQALAPPPKKRKQQC